MAGKGRKRPGTGERVRPSKDKSGEGTRQDSISSLSDSKDKDFLPSRYLTRYSTTIIAQSSTLRNPVRSVKKINRPEIIFRDETHQEPLSGNGDNTMPAVLQQCTSTLSRQHNLQIPDNDHVIARSINLSAPISGNVMNLDNYIFHEAISQSCQQETVRSCLKRTNYNVGETVRPDKSTQNSLCFSREHSVNVTEFAKMLHDDVDDDEEVESALDPGFEFVNGHKVNVETAPLLRRIFTKHGDITTRAEFESPKSLSNFLEQLCGVYEKLERTKFLKLTRAEINGMIADVRDCERVNLNVGWIREKLDFISETWANYERYASLKEEVGNHDASIGSLEAKLDVYKSQLCEMQQKLSAVEEELATKKGKIEPKRIMVLDTKARVIAFVKGNLVEGLL